MHHAFTGFGYPRLGFHLLLQQILKPAAVALSEQEAQGRFRWWLVDVSFAKFVEDLAAMLLLRRSLRPGKTFHPK
jgi:hypothetical protein